MKKWVLIFLSIVMMLGLAVPVLAEAGTAEAAQGAANAAYTVEFNYEGRQYVMPGDSTVRLSEILDGVGLTGAVEAVAVSDASLFSASNETGAWIVTAHQAFDTTEWMKVTVTMDRKECRIYVNDAERGIFVQNESIRNDPGTVASVSFQDDLDPHHQFLN